MGAQARGQQQPQQQQQERFGKGTTQQRRQNPTPVDGEALEDAQQLRAAAGDGGGGEETAEAHGTAASDESEGGGEEPQNDGTLVGAPNSQEASSQEVGPMGRPVRARKQAEYLGMVRDERPKRVRKPTFSGTYLEREGAGGGPLKYLIRIGHWLKTRIAGHTE